MSFTKLKQKITSKKSKIGVVGLGYVGLPLAHAFAESGYPVLGIDIDAPRVASIKAGKSYISDLPSSALAREVRAGRLDASSNYNSLKDLDIIIVCVPTPLNRAKDPDISFIVSVTDEIARRPKKGRLIILESTTYPGTTEEVILPALQKTGLKIGSDFFLCFSPERIDPANAKFKTKDIPKVVGGVTANCTNLGALLYAAITPKVVRVSSPRTAEMAKLLENTFRIVNIGLINELALAAKNLQVNIWEVIEAAKTKPFGFMAFYPGPGVGGHCIGVDPIYLSWKARSLGSDLNFIELARRINAEMPDHVVSQAVYALNQYSHKAISRSKVLVLGASYKKDVSDVRESPALDILTKLRHLGANVTYHDPYVPEIRHESQRFKSQALTPALLKKQDLVILATDHSVFDYAQIVKSSRLIYDTRNAFSNFNQKHIVRL